jgi:hypothetical protein
MILSILIPVLPERYPQFMRLLHELQRQVSYMHRNNPTLGLIEICFDDRPSFLHGGPSIGGKRNFLRQKALGKYQAQLDMDDWIAPNYIETLVRLAQEDKDVLTFNCLFTNDDYWTIINMSFDNKEDEQASPERIIKRKPWHVCGIKSEIARKEHFNDELNHGEDVEWMSKIMQHVNSGIHSDKILTQYNHSASGSEADKILKAGYR